MSSTLDLEAYFDRIGFVGLREPTLKTLCEIVARHPAAIPFENLDVLLGRGVRVDIASVFDKLVTRQRGGYCFEQNFLLLSVLQALGFEAAPMSARVRLQTPRDVTPPRTHLWVKVLLDGVPYLADVGVGGISPCAPLRLDTDSAQSTSHEQHRIVREEGKSFHQALFGENWADVYDFTLEAMPPIDRELANWYTSTHPDSKFRKVLFVARANPDGTRYGLQNHEFTHRRGAQTLETRTIGSNEELLEVLNQKFGIRLEPGTVVTIPAMQA